MLLLNSDTTKVTLKAGVEHCRIEKKEKMLGRWHAAPLAVSKVNLPTDFSLKMGLSLKLKIINKGQSFWTAPKGFDKTLWGEILLRSTSPK